MSDRTIITCPDCGEDFLEDYYGKYCCDQLEKIRKEDLRDRFAMAALTGANANAQLIERIKQDAIKHNNGACETMATYCYEIADAMMKAREGR